MNNRLSLKRTPSGIFKLLAFDGEIIPGQCFIQFEKPNQWGVRMVNVRFEVQEKPTVKEDEEWSPITPQQEGFYWCRDSSIFEDELYHEDDKADLCQLKFFGSTLYFRWTTSIEWSDLSNIRGFLWKGPLKP